MIGAYRQVLEFRFSLARCTDLIYDSRFPKIQQTQSDAFEKFDEPGDRVRLPFYATTTTVPIQVLGCFKRLANRPN